MARKADIRAQIKSSLNLHTKAQLEEKRTPLLANLTSLLSTLKYQHILSYSPHFHGEIEVPALENSNSISALPFLPKITGSEMSFHQIEADSKLESGKFSILEPKAEWLQFTEELQLPAIILIPGLAFDSKGNRLGRGMGYYDRFLTKYPSLIKIGLCYDFQLISEVPFEDHDVRMDYIVSDASTIDPKLLS